MDHADHSRVSTRTPPPPELLKNGVYEDAMEVFYEY